jgi:hypothetical protein
MRGAPGLGVQAAHGLAGDAVPVAVELRGPLVQEDEPGEIGGPPRVTGHWRVEHWRVQRVAQLVGGPDVHLGLAKQNGASESELVEAITHLAFYAGWPKAMSAMAVAKRVFRGE